MLKEKVAYLAGPMEYCNNNGIGWRLEWEKDLIKIGIRSIIPNLEEANIIDSQEKFRREKLQTLGKYIDTMREIILKDLAIIEKVDLVITRWNGEKGAGTIGEAQHAFLKGKINYLVTSMPFHEVPGWFLACFTDLFHSKEELIKFLKVNKNKG